MLDREVLKIVKEGFAFDLPPEDIVTRVICAGNYSRKEACGHLSSVIGKNPDQIASVWTAKQWALYRHIKAELPVHVTPSISQDESLAKVADILARNKEPT